MRFRALALLLMLATPAVAQESTTAADKGFITGFLERNLSGMGRAVTIDGFEGALSSRATFTRMTIADQSGVWLTILDGAIAWNRTALLSGNVEIAELSAGEIDMPRLPGTTASGLPSPEARGFSLPDLPVSVSVGVIRADKVVLGQPVLGAEVSVALSGAMKLAGGEGTTDLKINRIDGAQGELNLTGSFTNATRKLALDLLVNEGAGGIAATRLGLPGAPSVTLAVHGDDVIDDFKADIALSTDGAPRLTGQVTLKTDRPEGAAAPDYSFNADLRGDVSPLLQPDYQAFFGTSAALTAAGRRLADGQTELTELRVTSQAVSLAGQALIDADGLPRTADLGITLGLADKSDVVLPLTGDRTTLRDGQLRLSYDAAKGEDWTLKGQINGVKRPDIAIATLRIDGSGTIARPATGVARVDGKVGFGASGIAPRDADLATALGDAMNGTAEFRWQTGTPLSLTLLDATGAGLHVVVQGAVQSTADGSAFNGTAWGEIADITRFSGLAGRRLGGAATFMATGSIGLLSGVFDVDAQVAGTGLRIDQPQLDHLMQDGALITASVRRDTAGTVLRKATLRAASFSTDAAGRITSDGADLTANMDFADLGALGQGFGGALLANAHLVDQSGARHLVLTGQGTGLRIGQAEADRLLAGKSSLRLEARQQDGITTIDTFDLANPQVTATASGQSQGATQQIDFSARLANMALLVPDFPGPVTATGKARNAGTGGWQITMDAGGPGGTRAAVSGSIADSLATADLRMTGSAQAGLANPFIGPRNIGGNLRFDLRMNGAPGVRSLTGRVDLTGGRITDPVLALAAENLTASATLAGGQARIDAKAGVRGGGNISVAGPVALTPPFNADLAVDLAAVRLRDPSLYDTRVNGGLKIAGPLTGGGTIAGSVALDQTEILVPTSGFGGYADIEPIFHIREQADVRATRQRAGLIGGPGKAGAKPTGSGGFGLDIAMSAPSRIFVRGRGLDAEMGGSLRLAGTTDAIIPIGQFSLIRGRLDLLGKRFDLDTGEVTLEGAAIPIILFEATSTTDAVTATIRIEGPASEPAITFTSSPQLPQEEVVAQLLFGKGLDGLSLFQAAQLASAVATLTGRGGQGIVGRLRSSFGLDDLDVKTDADGNFGLTFGKYLTSKLYTDVTLGGDGTTDVNLNLDVSKYVTLRGMLGSDGNTGVGVYYERDY